MTWTAPAQALHTQDGHPSDAVVRPRAGRRSERVFWAGTKFAPRIPCLQLLLCNAAAGQFRLLAPLRLDLDRPLTIRPSWMYTTYEAWQRSKSASTGAKR